ncbi:MAG: non-canonical purine NTP pyrophosphatase [Planctomycetota bacterium]|jgi:XTP/dITP diphosphohydrolase
MPQSILLASGNAKKLAELRALCEDLPIRILGPADLPEGLPEVEEDQPDFVGNAGKKALSAARAAADQLGEQVWALADDSGLCVDALDGDPGVFSARYASMEDPATNSGDSANNARLLRELDGVPESKRSAAFHCVIAVARQGELLFTVAGKVEGIILDKPDGEKGFGYDPLFFHPPSATTFARLTAEQKASVSHRGEAVRRLRGKLLASLKA